jgi:FXSXX-COOH protein
LANSIIQAFISHTSGKPLDSIVADSEPSEPGDQRLSSDLIDVSHLTLKDLRDMADTAMARSIRRIHAEMESPLDAVAGFQSSI